MMFPHNTAIALYRSNGYSLQLVIQSSTCKATWASSLLIHPAEHATTVKESVKSTLVSPCRTQCFHIRLFVNPGNYVSRLDGFVNQALLVHPCLRDSYPPHMTVSLWTTGNHMFNETSRVSLAISGNLSCYAFSRIRSLSICHSSKKGVMYLPCTS